MFAGIAMKAARICRTRRRSSAASTAAVAVRCGRNVIASQRSMRSRTRRDYGWRQTAPFIVLRRKANAVTVGPRRPFSLCIQVRKRLDYNGHAGFQVSKLYSKRHRLSDVVQEFLDAEQDQEALKKWTNTALAELWEPKYSETFDPNALLARAEAYDGDDLPEDVRVVTGFCDVQGDRLEVQLIGWGADEEAWPFQYTIIHQDPAQPQAWRELENAVAVEVLHQDRAHAAHRGVRHRLAGTSHGATCWRSRARARAGASSPVVASPDRSRSGRAAPRAPRPAT
jgi:hypothetical protein